MVEPELLDGAVVLLVSPPVVPDVVELPLAEPVSVGGLTAPAAPPALSVAPVPLVEPVAPEFIAPELIEPEFIAPELIEPLMGEPVAAPLLAEALALVPVAAIVDPAHQSLLARCRGEAAR